MMHRFPVLAAQHCQWRFERLFQLLDFFVEDTELSYSLPQLDRGNVRVRVSVSVYVYVYVCVGRQTQ